MFKLSQAFHYFGDSFLRSRDVIATARQKLNRTLTELARTCLGCLEQARSLEEDIQASPQPCCQRPLFTPPTASQATSVSVKCPYIIALSSSEQHEAGKSSSHGEFLASSEFCTRKWWHRETVPEPSPQTNPRFCPAGSGTVKTLSWGWWTSSSVSKQTLQIAPPWPFWDWQCCLSWRDRCDEGPVWPRAPGEYSRSQNMDLTHETAAPGTGFLLPGSKGSANETSFVSLRKWLPPRSGY